MSQSGIANLSQSGGGSLANMHLTASQTLTADQIRSLNASPVTLIPAAGANMQINVIAFTYIFKYGGNNSFTAGSAISAYIGTTVAGSLNVAGTISSTVMTGTLDTCTYKVATSPGTASGTNMTNLPVILGASSTEYAGNAANDNTLTVQVLYYLTNLS